MCGQPAVFDGAAYDPVTDTWRTIADGPVPADGAPTQLIPQGAWTGSEFVVWGGWGDPIAAAYDPTTDRWRDLPPGPLEPRAGQAVVAWADRVAVVGGQTQDLSPRRPATTAPFSIPPPASGHSFPISRPQGSSSNRDRSSPSRPTVACSSCHW